MASMRPGGARASRSRPARESESKAHLGGWRAGRGGKGRGAMGSVAWGHRERVQGAPTAWRRELRAWRGAGTGVERRAQGAGGGRARRRRTCS
eukprot:scaffold70990_cov49-Phaeocystis_antarctica.AAC.2